MTIEKPRLTRIFANVIEAISFAERLLAAWSCQGQLQRRSLLAATAELFRIRAIRGFSISDSLELGTWKT
jgi:hypothetical protein